MQNVIAMLMIQTELRLKISGQNETNELQDDFLEPPCLIADLQKLFKILAVTRSILNGNIF